MKIIGLSGKKQSGKDTVFALLRDAMPGKRVERVAFADALKAELAQACGVTLEDIEKQKARFRMGLQWWGTEFKRGNDPEYWIKRAAEKVAALREEGADLVVVTDCRFPDEGQYVQRAGGKVVKIVRSSESTDSHASETSMDGFQADFIIDNTGTLEALRRNVALLANIITLMP